MQSFTIIGPGRMGGALAIALNRAGYRIDALIDRKGKSLPKLTRYISPRPKILSIENLERIDSEAVLITTPDRHIVDVSLRIAGLLSPENKFIFHTSGSLSSIILEPFSELGHSIGSIHPLVSVSSPTVGARNFAGAYFCIEGDADAVEVGTRIVERLHGRPFSLKTESKPLYHLAAVLAAGHLVALADVAFSLMARTGLGIEKARTILIPLIKSTVANLESQQTVEALTGPIARGDLTVLERHIEVLSRVASRNECDVYLDLALRSIEMVELANTGLELTELRNLILLAKQNTK